MCSSSDSRSMAVRLLRHDIKRFKTVRDQINALYPEYEHEYGRLLSGVEPRANAYAYDDLMRMAETKLSGSFLLEYVFNILFDLIAFQDKARIENILDLLTDSECSRLIWKTKFQRGFNMPLIFYACAIPTPTPYLIENGFPGSIYKDSENSDAEMQFAVEQYIVQVREQNTAEIIDLLMQRGGYQPGTGITTVICKKGNYGNTGRVAFADLKDFLRRGNFVLFKSADEWDDKDMYLTRFNYRTEYDVSRTNFEFSYGAILSYKRFEELLLR